MSKVRAFTYLLEGVSVAARIHLPEDRKSGARSPGVLIIPGFADTAIGPHNMHVQLARFLASAGFAVLRFDYRGLGESEGDFKHFTGLTGYFDCREALHQLLQQPEVDPARIFVAGYSLGGYYASRLAAEAGCIRGLALIAPVAYPVVLQTFFKERDLKAFQQYGWTDWQGWPVGAAFLQSLANMPPYDELAHDAWHSALVIHGTDDVEIPFAHAMAYASSGATIIPIEGGDHAFSSCRVQSEVERRIGHWFRQLLYKNHSIEEG